MKSVMPSGKIQAYGTGDVSPKVEPVGMSLSNSAGDCGKLENKDAGRGSVGMGTSAEEASPRKIEGGIMKRIGSTSGIMEEITRYGNISQSIDVVLAGKRRKKMRTGHYILSHRDEVISKLQEEIRCGTFSLSGYREMEVRDGGKVRKVQSVNLYERIGCNAVMHVVERHVFGRYIRTTAASIKNRGMHDLKAYIQKDMELDPEGTRYCYKFDIRKFYESIDQRVMMDTLRLLFKDKTLLAILERFVRMMPQGLSIGLRSSQAFGNILLSAWLDHHLKDKCGVRHYYRYCDDGVVLAGTKAELWKVRDMVHRQAGRIGLEVKPSERVFPATEGIDFLGYVIYPAHARLRKRNKQNAARKLHIIKSKRRRREIMASLYGQCKHADCRNLFNRLTGMEMEGFKRLSETGIKPKYNDGKKRFEGNEVNLADLVGEEFVIMDFEVGVVTKPQRRDYEEKVARQRRELENYTSHGITPPEGFVYPENVAMPEGKYVICLRRNIGNAGEAVQKSFTGDGENKSILDQMRERGLLGKTLCSVKAIRCKGFNRYVLC